MRKDLNELKTLGRTVEASKDYDRPDIPLEKRGFNFVLKTPEALRAQAGGGEAELNPRRDLWYYNRNANCIFK